MFGLGRIERIERTLAQAGIDRVYRLDGRARTLPPGLPAPTLLVHTRAVFSPRLLPWLAARHAAADPTGLLVTDATGAPVMASVADPGPLQTVPAESPGDAVGLLASGGAVTPPHDIVCLAPPPGPVPSTTPGLWRLCSKPTERWHLRGVRKACFPAIAALADRGVHPETVTWVGFWVAVAGAVTMVAGGYAGSIAGALLLYAAWVLDSMDGALARLTFRSSARGAALDTWLGRIAHLLTALAAGWLAYGVRGAWYEALTAFGIMVAGGVLLISAAGRVDRLAPGDGPLWRIRASFEHVLHRDNALAILVCAVFERLDVFIWLAVAVLYAALAVDLAILTTARDQAIE